MKQIIHRKVLTHINFGLFGEEIEDILLSASQVNANESSCKCLHLVYLYKPLACKRVGDRDVVNYKSMSTTLACHTL